MFQDLQIFHESTVADHGSTAHSTMLKEKRPYFDRKFKNAGDYGKEKNFSKAFGHGYEADDLS
jgi:hypothetical protein